MKVVAINEKIINCEEIRNIEFSNFTKDILVFYKNPGENPYSSIHYSSKNEANKILQLFYDEMTSEN